MTNDKKAMNINQKFVASMLETASQTHEVRAQSASDNVDVQQIDKVMLNIKKGVYRTK